MMTTMVEDMVMMTTMEEDMDMMIIMEEDTDMMITMVEDMDIIDGLMMRLKEDTVTLIAILLGKPSKDIRSHPITLLGRSISFPHYFIFI